jgi:hypothetical protein
MANNFLDNLGILLCGSIFIMPFITIPLTWKHSNHRPIFKVLLGLLFAVILSFFLYLIGLAIILRDGLGPG